MRFKRGSIVALVLVAMFGCGLLLASCGKKGAGGEKPASTLQAGKKDIPKPGSAGAGKS